MEKAFTPERAVILDSYILLEKDGLSLFARAGITVGPSCASSKSRLRPMLAQPGFGSICRCDQPAARELKPSAGAISFEIELH
jgi:hypothetical protein